MSFIDIKDPRKRDEIVADYLSIIKRVQQRNEEERSASLTRQAQLETTFNPIIKATETAAKTISRELKPLHEELKTVSNKIETSKNPTIIYRKRTWDDRTGVNALTFYLSKYDKKNLDKYYGIQLDDDKFMMGNKEVQVYDNSNISVDNEVYTGTPGLWSLIMLASPDEKSYTEEDMNNYKDLVDRTNVKNNPRNVLQNSRPKQTVKRRMLETFSRDGEDEEEEEKEKEEDGSGVIQFLPGDIKGLSAKLNLLLAEYAAGNRSTRNEIVGILDELKRRKSISQKEYTDINTFLSKNLK